MTDQCATTGQVEASAAGVYDEFFVPALFGQWTGPVLDAAAVAAGDDVLDVGCGTGVLARAAARRVGGAGSVTGLDPNGGMLAVARRTSEPVSWRAGAAEALPFPDAVFDRVVSQFALMFFADRAAGLAEMGRVARPGGTVAVATWARVEESPGYAAMVDLLRRLFGTAAADALSAPFVLGTPALLRSVMEPVFGAATITRHEGVARFDSVDAWVHTDVRGWTLSGLIDDDQHAALLDAARVELAAFVDADGRVAFLAPALIATVTVAGGP